MKKLLGNRNIIVTTKQLQDFYAGNAKLEHTKAEALKKLMEDKIKAATKGSTIVVSNYSKS
jgi:hypothetical protein